MCKLQIFLFDVCKLLIHLSAHCKMTTQPFITIPITPSRRLTDEKLSNFLRSVESKGEDPHDVLSDMIADSITQYDKLHAPTRPTSKKKGGAK